jgi:high-affinity iron transporter
VPLIETSIAVANPVGPGRISTETHRGTLSTGVIVEPAPTARHAALGTPAATRLASPRNGKHASFVGESLLIKLREGFEAALVVAIVLAAVRRSPRPDLAHWVWMGTAAAAGLALAVGLVIHATIDDLTGDRRARTFAVICFAAAALLTWMIFWMRAHARSLKGELEGRAERAMEQSAFALGMVAFVAVAREGLETALFLVSTTTSSSSGDVLLGAIIGLLLACLLGVLVYHGSRFVPVKTFFQVTGVLVILFAAGLLARGVMFLQASGDIGSVNLALYDVTRFHWLTVSTQSGRFLAGIFGWDPRPSAEQVVVYVGYLVPVLIAFFWPGSAPTHRASAQSTDTQSVVPA